MSITHLIHKHSYNIARQESDPCSPLHHYRRRRSIAPRDGRIPAPTRPSTTAAIQQPAASTSAAPSLPEQGYEPPTAASFYIPSLPGLSPDSTLTLYGGHLPSTDLDSDPEGLNDAHLFFFLAKAKHVDSRQKLVLWLNGGELGCVALSDKDT